jgi:chromosome segregation protein
MRVARLEVFGFKSFMEKTVLPLEGGMTAIVGPNGCGKSNIVDALRWVLGETRASSLRGGTLEDVIFNGTDTLRPLGLAEVSLTLVAEGASVFDDIISQGRTLLSSENLSPDLTFASEFSLVGEVPSSREALPLEALTNGKVDLFLESNNEDKKNGRPHLVVLDGGKDALDNGSSLIHPADAPNESLDETITEPNQASQVVLSSQVDESDILEPGQRTALSKFLWLRGVSEIQVTRRVYRSGESEFFINRVASRLKDIKELFRAIGLGARAYTIVAQGEVGRIVTAKPEERRLIIEEAAGVVGFRERLVESGRRLSETDQHILRMDDIITELSRQVSALKRMADRALNRREITEEIETLEVAVIRDLVTRGRDSRESGEDALERHIDDEKNLAQLVEELILQHDTLQEDFERFDASGGVLRNRVSVLRDTLIAKQQARREKESKLNEFRGILQARNAELSRTQERASTLSSRLETLRLELKELEKEDTAIANEIAHADRSSEEELRTVSAALHAKRHELKQGEHKMRELRDALVSSQGRMHTIQEQIIASSPLTQLSKSLGGAFFKEVAPDAQALLDCIKVPPHLAKAVQAILGDRAKFLLVDDIYAAAERFVDEVNKRPKEMRGVGLGVLGKGELSFKDSGDSVTLPPLASLLEVRPEAIYGISFLLRRVYFAETLVKAREFFSHEVSDALSDLVVVTQEGDIVTKNSFYSLRHDGGAVQLRVHAESLAVQITHAEEACNQHASLREAIQGEVQSLEVRHGEVLKENQQKQALMRDLGKRQGVVRGRLHSERRLVGQMEVDVQKATAQLDECQRRIAEVISEEALIKESLELHLVDSDKPLENELSELNDKIAHFESTRGSMRKDFLSCQQELSRNRRALEEVRERVQQKRLASQKRDLEEAAARERFIELYGEDSLITALEELSSPLTQDEQRKTTEKLRSLRNRVAREGEVDPSTIDQYQLELRRLDDLKAQRQDLIAAASTLRDSVQHLTEAAQKQFMATFNGIKDRFSLLIPRLFGGGKGELTLSSPEAPLQGGVEIFVRPPGKKPKSIDSLSGGEKALSATAMIVSMFLERPSPLCVLDEVDAPLDEANLLRFLEVIKEMSSKTQFLIITHNKQSMCTSKHLVGVTQQEPGASKLITVSLHDALAHVA